MIRCRECGKLLKVITRTHLRVHGDKRLDDWCSKNGWLFLRLTDLDIAEKPKTCRNKIRRLLRGANS